MRRFRHSLNVWTLGTCLVLVLVLFPLGYILLAAWGEAGETWAHLQKTVLPQYLLNTLALLLGTGGLTALLGVSTAWLISSTRFPGRKWLAWALILPLSIPTYIVAFAYAGIFDYTGPLQVAWRNWFPGSTGVDIMNIPMMIVLLSLVLYPYVYLICRASFGQQSRSIWEASRSLGHSPWGSFFRVALPLARPALIGGLSLVMMEVLNDYGAVKYFGIPTFTTGIFRAWFGLGDPLAAVRLSAYLLLFVLILVMLERWQRGKQQVAALGNERKPLLRLRGVHAWLALGICCVPLALGFILPMGQLLLWASRHATDWLEPDFWVLIRNSFLLAAGAALLCVVAALLLAYTRRLFPLRWVLLPTRLAVLGYAIPGAVIAVGVMIPALAFTDWINGLWEAGFGYRMGSFLESLFISILLAYLVRFLAVAYNPLESGLERVNRSLDESARSLGHGAWSSLWRVDLPLMRGSMLAAFILVFVDVLKELPLTLILRPFNFDSLATRTFELASDERLSASAVPALWIVLIGLVPIIWLNRLMRDFGKDHGGTEAWR